jgi:hypothetical protein
MALLAALPMIAGAQDLFQLDFQGTGRFLSDNGRLETRRITAEDLIARCVGEQALGTNNLGTNRQYDLVYNATADSVQVVNFTNGSFVCDVFQFQGGASNVDRRHLGRLAFVFVPEQNESVGSVIIAEKFREQTDRLSMHGQIHFAIQSLVAGSSAGARFTSPSPGSTNSAGSGSTNSTDSGTVTNIPITSPVVATPPVVDPTPTLILSTNSVPIGDPALVSPPTSVTPPLNTSNSIIGLAVAPAALEVSSGLTNGVEALSLTNAVICSGRFSTGLRVPLSGSTR